MSEKTDDKKDTVKSHAPAVEAAKEAKEEKAEKNVASITNLVETDAGHVGDADAAAIAHQKAEADPVGNAGKKKPEAGSSLDAEKDEKK